MHIIEWIDSVGGPAKAAELLKESPRTVASWYYGEKLPKPQTACKIVRITKWALDYNRIYSPLIARMAEKESKSLLRKADKA